MQNPSVGQSLNGAMVYPGALETAVQKDIIEALRHCVAAAPLFSPDTPNGRKMSVRMTSAGKYGWYSDKAGYRYVERHPSGRDWPAIPDQLCAIWRRFGHADRAPDCCLINFYGEGARMGMHQDRDEADFSWPVVSVSLGDDGLFRVGGTTQRGPTRSLWLKSGDVVVLGGDARLAYHGVDRIRFASSPLLPQGGRINLTMRVVD